MRAHDFTTSLEHDDNECGTCQVRAAPGVTLAVPCPAGDCPSPDNPERGCVFIAARNCACCIFCGRTGGTAVEPDEFSEE